MTVLYKRIAIAACPMDAVYMKSGKSISLSTVVKYSPMLVLRQYFAIAFGHEPE